MKKFKYLCTALIMVLLSVYLYQIYIYYKIPYNPISEYATTPSGFHITNNLADGKEVTVKTHDLDACDSIYKYFRGLELVPLKDKEAYKQESQTYFSGMFEFTQAENLHFNEINSDNMSILYISSNRPGFHGGYYKIIGSEFDYEYIINLINISQK